VDVSLTWYEMLHGAHVGALRLVQVIEEHRQPTHGQQGYNWHNAIEGTMAELAVAKGLNLYWAGIVGDFKAPDVGPLQVRYTDRPTGHLLLHKSDKDEDFCVFVIGSFGKYRLVGWCKIGTVKRDEFWRDPTGSRPCYFVPQSALNPMEELTKDKYL
jgi:hypothetical protein